MSLLSDYNISLNNISFLTINTQKYYTNKFPDKHILPLHSARSNNYKSTVCFSTVYQELIGKFYVVSIAQQIPGPS